jgi:hypothetical protein
VDVGRLSLMDDEEEVLFLPFSSFKIEKIEKENDVYKIELKYLAKYFKIYEKDFTTLSSKIPDSEFKKEIFGSKLIKIEENASINPKKLIEEYNSHKIDAKLNSSKLNLKTKINLIVFFLQILYMIKIVLLEIFLLQTKI